MAVVSARLRPLLIEVAGAVLQAPRGYGGGIGGDGSDSDRESVTVTDWHLSSKDYRGFFSRDSSSVIRRSRVTSLGIGISTRLDGMEPKP